MYLYWKTKSAEQSWKGMRRFGSNRLSDMSTFIVYTSAPEPTLSYTNVYWLQQSIQIKTCQSVISFKYGCLDIIIHILMILCYVVALCHMYTPLLIVNLSIISWQDIITDYSSVSFKDKNTKHPIDNCYYRPHANNKCTHITNQVMKIGEIGKQGQKMWRERCIEKNKKFGVGNGKRRAKTTGMWGKG